MRRSLVLAALVLSTSAFATDFTRVYQTGDSLPGDPAETFTSFDAPATDGTTVSFFGRGTDREGIFTSAHGLAVVAERTTLFPGTTVNFAFFGGPLVENGMTLVSGLGAGGMSGIYLGDGGPLTVVADVFTRVPGAHGTFTEFGGMALAGSRTVFQGKDVAFHTGIYARTAAGTLSPVATARTGRCRSWPTRRRRFPTIPPRSASSSRRTSRKARSHSWAGTRPSTTTAS